MRRQKVKGVDFNSYMLFCQYLSFEKAGRIIVKEYRIRYSYLCVFLYLYYQGQAEITSAYGFRPYVYNYTLMFMPRVYTAGVTVLRERGIIEKVGNTGLKAYKITPEGQIMYNRLYNYYSRQMKKYEVLYTP